MQSETITLKFTDVDECKTFIDRFSLYFNLLAENAIYKISDIYINVTPNMLMKFYKGFTGESDINYTNHGFLRLRDFTCQFRITSDLADGKIFGDTVDCYMPLETVDDFLYYAPFMSLEFSRTGCLKIRIKSSVPDYYVSIFTKRRQLCI